MATHLYFVRHGESNSNEDGTFRGKAAALTEKGKKEAEMVAQRLARIGVDALIASSYERTLQTAAPASAALGLPIVQSDLLVEWRRPSAHIGSSRKDPQVDKESKKILDEFGFTDYHHSDEETFEQMRERALAALAYLENYPLERVAVVTHGIFLRMLLCVIVSGPACNGEDFNRAWRFFVSNTGVSYIRKLPEDSWQSGWEIMSWNDSSHLG
ncbi:MAG: hypothetical protein JWO84_586 [Parcubacteria group bacterium]|nr:hypothetical protein [Parcubacteria group bacterium]